MSSRKLAYLYLPLMAIFLIGIGTVMKLLSKEPIPNTFWIFLPVMVILLALGIKGKVWNDK